MAVEWSLERLSAKTSKELQQIAENAGVRGRSDVVAMCEQLLEERLRAGKDYMSVAEFHFVCAKDSGIHELPDGRFTSGVWLVADVHRQPSLRDRSIVALHEAKAAHSYRQGIIVGWDDVPRGEFGEGMGVRFTVEPTVEPLEWKGGGSGEKGYLWREKK